MANRLSGPLLAAACAVGLIVVAEQSSSAQARYQPSTPTVSPYLNLGNGNFGGLPSYYALVRPQIQQRAENRQVQSIVGSQGRDIRSLQNEVQQGLQPASATGISSWFMAPGTRQQFLNTTHFYPPPAARRPRR